MDVIPPHLGFDAFAQRLLQLLDEGRFVATYKFAVLLGLLDVLVETVGQDGQAPATVSTRDLAAKVVEIYWPHTLEFDGDVGRLRQNQRGQAEIVGLIATFREKTVGDESLPISRARWKKPGGFEKLVRAVEWKLVEMPLGKLQLVGNQYDPFIYRLSWNERPKQSEVKADNFDGRLLLVPDAGEHLLRSAPLLRPLVRTAWTLTVARFNKLKQAELQDFLFGAERVSLAPVSGDLRQLAEARCFYCGETVKGPGHIDHFIPWARHMDNGVHNLVFAHGTCNGDKSVNLAAAEHLDRWLVRFADQGPVLNQIASDKHWPTHGETTLAAARAIYLRLPESYKLWQARKEFVSADPAQLAEMFTAAT